MKWPIFLCSLLVISMVSAVTIPLPTLYWGYVTEHGNPVNGLRIQVFDSEGKLIGMDTTGNDGQGRDGMYAFEIQWDNPETEDDEGVVNGEELRFMDGDTLIKRVLIGGKGDTIQVDIELSEKATGVVTSSSSFQAPDEVDPNGVPDSELPVEDDSQKEGIEGETHKNEEPKAETTITVGGKPVVQDSVKEQDYLTPRLLAMAGAVFIVALVLVIVLRKRG